MQLKDILRAKGSNVHVISPSATLSDVVTRLVSCNCGSLVVVSDEDVIGIITERDILCARANKNESLNDMTVEATMTRDVIKAHPDDEVNSVMGLLTEKRIRHLPVLENNRLAGMISIGDVVKAQYDHLQMENHFLKNYIQS